MIQAVSKSKAGRGADRLPSGAMNLDRHEAKYLIHPRQVPSIRAFVEPFCMPDRHAPPDHPEYVVTTLQLDTHDGALYRAKETEAINRFKLRVRTYGLDGTCPVFLEIKRKIKGVISKSRVPVPSSYWTEALWNDPIANMPPLPARHQHNYIEFFRLVRELGATPKVLLRYHRESYMGTNDLYSRLTIDRRLCYRPARDWMLMPERGPWWCIDTEGAMSTPFSAMILELKTYAEAPLWMVDLTERFDLVRSGFSKYYNAMRCESLFYGEAYSMAGESCEGW